MTPIIYGVKYNGFVDYSRHTTQLSGPVPRTAWTHPSNVPSAPYISPWLSSTCECTCISD
jgi:hypothetical protein